MSFHRCEPSPPRQPRSYARPTAGGLFAVEDLAASSSLRDAHCRGIMRETATQLRSSAIASALLVLPFVSLEAINRRRFDEGFPFPVFGILWLLAMAFILTHMPLVRIFRGGDTLPLRSANLMLRAAFLIVIAWLWVSILRDQIPCFLGVPNCD